MSLSYRGTQYEASGERKVNKTAQLYNQIYCEHQSKLSEYNTLHKQLSDAKDVELNDSVMSNETDDKIVKLSTLRDELIALSAQLELFNKL